MNYITGVMPERLANNPALQEWYKVNFPSWETNLDRYIVPDPVSADAADDDDAKDSSEDVETNPNAITLPEPLTSRNIKPLISYLRAPGKGEGTRNCRRLRMDP